MNVSLSDIWDKFWEKYLNRTEDLINVESTTWLVYKKLLYPFKSQLIGKDLVELGCGSAINSLRIARDFSMHTVLVDYSDKALSLAKEVSEIMGVYDVEFKKMNILDFDESGFSLSHSAGVVEHYPSYIRQSIIEKHAESVKSGGYCLTMTSNRLNPFILLNILLHKLTRIQEYGYTEPLTVKILRDYLIGSKLIPIKFDGINIISSASGLLSLSPSTKDNIKTSLRPYKTNIEHLSGMFPTSILPYIGGDIAVLSKKL